MTEKIDKLAALWPGIWSYHTVLKARGEDCGQGIRDMLEIERLTPDQIEKAFEHIRAWERELGSFID